MPETFYTKSLFTKKKGKKSVCHPSAWDIGDGDVRFVYKNMKKGDIPFIRPFYVNSIFLMSSSKSADVSKRTWIWTITSEYVMNV